MNIKQILPLFVLVIAIGWFMPPDYDPIVIPANEARPVQMISAAAPNAGFDSGRDNDVQQLLLDQITLSREADGHFYADIDVNFNKIHFLVDTGASMVALTGDDARKLGMNWSADELRPVARGASGDVLGKRVMIDKMQIGNFQANNVPAAIIPQGLDVSLLGQSFLVRVGSVNIQDDKMVFN